MENTPDRELVEEATDIFLRLRDAPDDASILQIKKAFLARGKAETEAWNRVARVWHSKPKPKSRGTALTIAAALVSAGLWAWASSNNVWSSIVADAYSGSASEIVHLSSGDIVHLDASSAIQQDITQDQRGVALLQGAAVFDVKTNPSSPFTVTIDEIMVEVLGTVFEVARYRDEVLVSVSEGRVSISSEQGTKTLDTGQRGVWRGGSLQSVEQVDPTMMASWREDRLIADGLTFQQAVSIIDNRMPGAIVIMGEPRARISGTFDLRKPMSALRGVSAIEEAKIVSLPPFATIVYIPPR